MYEDAGLDMNLKPEVVEQKTYAEKIEALRLDLKRVMSHSKFGKIYLYAMIVLSVLSCIQFIYETYLDKHENNLELTANRRVEEVLAILFGMDWLLNLFLADDKITHTSRYVYKFDLFVILSLSDLVSFPWSTP